MRYKMNLWIRSQKNIIVLNISGVYVYENTIYGLENCKDSRGIRLGEYKSEKRTLKVLSDMRRFIKFNNVSNKIFKMPEE